MTCALINKLVVANVFMVVEVGPTSTTKEIAETAEIIKTFIVVKLFIKILLLEYKLMDNYPKIIVILAPLIL